LSTHPALALPAGRDESGLPFGLQLIGPLFQDGRLLAMAHALERAMASDESLLRPKPDVTKLHTDTANLKSIVTHPPRF
jgi:Asp-tRNA(Asn)/Glu-tRNA(Gln) amidotransferase A subunit family amidase